MEKFRTLRADEIDCRVSTVTAKGCSLLLYKDARCDMNILDETVGPMNWKRSHSKENANCTVELWDDEKKQWISKEDTGTESNTEKEKGLASDSFKRACFNWGIGRELYSAPFIWITKDKCKIEQKKNGNGYTCKDKFSVSKIGYDENGCINCLVIKKKGIAVFDMNGGDMEQSQEEPKQDVLEYPEEFPVTPATPAQIKVVKDLCKEHNVPFEAVMISNGLTEETLTGTEAANIINSFKKKYGDK